MNRPRHTDKEIEAVLRMIEARDWRVIKGRKYYKCYCPPPHAKCKKTVKLSPSDPNYAKNLRGWFLRQDCWKETP